jgi:hypothetical protein
MPVLKNISVGRATKPNKALRLALEAKEENLALQSICAILIGEVALMNQNPPNKLDQIVAGLQGMASGVAAGTDKGSKAMTETIERVCTMAEAAFDRGRTS